MIRTRFAPSPTGYLHIGGVRTALFNWLLARKSGGQFILRIDDTDAGRNVSEALQPILDGFRWLGIDWDEGPEIGGPHGPYYQSERVDLHKAAVKQLLDSGHAYRDYALPEELQAEREAASKRGERYFYDRRWMAEDDDAAAKYEAEGRQAVVRLKMPRDGNCVIEDLVRGTVTVAWETEQDHVIARADGSPLYHLASVIDDHEFGITHVVRAEEHLPNTPRQIFILESLGYERPQFAHLPYVAEPGGTAKLSKRKLNKYLKNKDFADLLAHGQRIAERCNLETSDETFNPVIVDFYRDIGFSAEALLNYLVLLGWSLDGEREKFSVAEMVEHFSLGRVTKSPASFDPQKLMAFQADHFAGLPHEDRLAAVTPFAVAAGLVSSESDENLSKVVAAAGDRLKVAGDIIDFDYFFGDDIQFEPKAFQKRIVKPEDACDLLSGFRQVVLDAEAFDADACESLLKGYCEQKGIKIGQIIHAVRVAVTGTAVGFGMFDTLAILGPERVAERIEKAVKNAADS
ncbi:glutamate--tRNA ligase [Roseiconus lacunae]|uniref:Glutamate--tRNA ligase n=1 Tax=Roseiconus lacunae TaxID=2605694 RepID=A0ABT7PMF5_9BACT|nr:glutamate--tRNA ligase [Roseiconus lacunae]MCD0458096.1 glutamate--tRNA ligase [Roseiconus lacunae]MDM4017464.1 glutamate--tRNA ligase [Roseiconus lacunae]